jgi:hypothetical protein
MIEFRLGLIQDRIFIFELLLRLEKLYIHVVGVVGFILACLLRLLDLISQINLELGDEAVVSSANTS